MFPPLSFYVTVGGEGGEEWHAEMAQVSGPELEETVLMECLT